MVDTHHAEEIDIKLLLRLLGFGELYRAGDAEACIVDDNVDVILFLKNVLQSAFNLRFVGNVGADMIGIGGGSAAELVHLAAFLTQGFDG